MNKLTQCPHCEATFKVSRDQLKAAGGKVRCGACMHIFDAMAHLFDAPASPSEPPKKTPLHQAPIAAQEELDAADPPDTELINDDPEVDAKSGNYVGQDLKRTRLSEEMLDLEQADNLMPDALEEPEENAPSSVDETWAEEMMNQDDSKDFSPTPAPAEEELFLVADPIYHNLDREDRAQNKNSVRPSFASAGLLSIFSLLLLGALIYQTSQYYYVQLATHVPFFEKAYSQMCALVPCIRSEQTDLSKIQSQKLSVRSHPKEGEALIVDAIVINEASHAQPFPVIALYFSDINKNVIAQRALTPQQYLAGEALHWTQMPSKVPIRIAVEIKDPGPSAVSYAISFYAQDAS